FERDPGHAFRRRFLKDVRKALGSRRLLLMLDELEMLEARIAAGDLHPRILPFFRSLMQHERHISFVFAGTHRLDELTHDYWGVLFNLAIYLEVGHLSQAEVRKLFEEPTKELFVIDPMALEAIWRLTAGHPYFSQLLARELVEHRNRQQLTYITVEQMEAVAVQVVEKGRLHLSYLFEEVSRSERLVVIALRDLLERCDQASLEEVTRLAIEREPEAADLDLAARTLVRRRILDDNTGQLRFRMELARRWLGSHPDLEAFARSEAASLAPGRVIRAYSG
ncbi:MAG: hypothetical protein MI919_40195, partial [Holophagales bacterium]|nr:hypothetical protein [Holophagales bacterium]